MQHRRTLTIDSLIFEVMLRNASRSSGTYSGSGSSNSSSRRSSVRVALSALVTIHRAHQNASLRAQKEQLTRAKNRETNHSNTTWDYSSEMAFY